jgi:hypothetical protein
MEVFTIGVIIGGVALMLLTFLASMLQYRMISIYVVGLATLGATAFMAARTYRVTRDHPENGVQSALAWTLVASCAALALGASVILVVRFQFSNFLDRSPYLHLMLLIFMVVLTTVTLEGVLVQDWWEDTGGVDLTKDLVMPLMPSPGNVDRVTNRLNGAFRGMTLCMWLGLSASKLEKLNTSQEIPNDEILAKIPLVMVGLPVVWKGDDKMSTDANEHQVDAEFTVAAPMITLVIASGRDPYFEVTFNHSTPPGAAKGVAPVLTEAKANATERDSCFFLNQYCARCQFGRSSKQISARTGLSKYRKLPDGGLDTRDGSSVMGTNALLHHVAFTFGAQYVPVERGSSLMHRKLRISMYLDDAAPQTLTFDGHMSVESTQVVVLPASDGSIYFIKNNDGVKGMLGDSYLAGVTVLNFCASKEHIKRLAAVPRSIGSFLPSRNFAGCKGADCGRDANVMEDDPGFQ